MQNKILARKILEPVQPEQYAYGHIEILRTAAGITDDQYILKYVIHHANHVSSFKNEFFDQYSVLGTPYKHLISSNAEVKKSQNKIDGEIVAIGSPWLYFCRVKGIDIAKSLEKMDLDKSVEIKFNNQFMYSTRKILGTGKFGSNKSFLDMFEENNKVYNTDLSIIPEELIKDTVLVFNIKHP